MATVTEKYDPLRDLQRYGESFWLDYIRRSLITGGELRRLMDEEGLRGVTSNPTIFDKAIAGSNDYDEAIRQFLRYDPGMSAQGLFEKLEIQDIQIAADTLRPVYEKTAGADGFVSLELPPGLARDTDGSIAKACLLWEEIARPNAMIKVPATQEGVPVIEALTARGINVNVTLIFSMRQYEAVAGAYMRGLEQCADPRRVASVASFFLSRIDTLVDNKLSSIDDPRAGLIKGKIAIALAKTAYRRFGEIFSGTRWERLAERGGRVQRLLWASTSTKNPAYSDVRYVEDTIGPDVINTMPPKTAQAFKDHGKVSPSLEKGLADAERDVKTASDLGISLEAIGEELQVKGIKLFEDSYNRLLSALEEKRRALIAGQAETMALRLGGYQSRVNDRLKYWETIKFMKRIWEKDPTLWFKKPVPELANRMGWLFHPDSIQYRLEDYIGFAEQIRSEGTTHVVLLGMGGSSLAPEFFQKTFGNKKGYPELIMLDSTHPSAVKAVEARISLPETLFVISSKSGTTIETLSLFKYFWNKMGRADGDRGNHFIAITDPGTPLEELAKERAFRRTFEGDPDVGGRYSALTAFGLVPAALIGVDIRELLDKAQNMSENCAFCVLLRNACGPRLGAAMGELATAGRDKITFLASGPLRYFPVWLEQLIAESTGKDGKGIIPIVNEPPAPPDAYGPDRFFVEFTAGPDGGEPGKMAGELVKAGQPLARVRLAEKIDIGYEIFCWEMAVASAGAVLGINPFNQPNVQMSKDLAKKMMHSVKGIAHGAGAMETLSISDEAPLRAALDSWLSAVKPGDYVAIQAYLAPQDKLTEALQNIRSVILGGLHIATTLGYGPRFLHSTGQLHKGGPNTGLFLQLVDDMARDLDVPETDYTFGELTRAESLGDYTALKQLGRRVIRVNLGKDAASSIARLAGLVREAVSIAGKPEAG